MCNEENKSYCKKFIIGIIAVIVFAVVMVTPILILKFLPDVTTCVDNWKLAIIVFFIVIVVCTALICITVIAVKKMEISKNNDIDRNREMLDQFLKDMKYQSYEKKEDNISTKKNVKVNNIQKIFFIQR